MENLLQTLVNDGFAITPQAGGWIVSKSASPTADWTLEPEARATLEEAVRLIWTTVESRPRVREFAATVRYNRGLGIEYKNLPIIQALTLQEAEEEAGQEAERLLGGPGVDIREVKVRPR